MLSQWLRLPRPPLRYYQPTTSINWSFAGLSGVVAAERAAGENVLFLHAGDSLSPSVLAGLDKGDHMVDLLNLISPDFMTVGNHEFDFGPDVLRNCLNFPMLAGNIADTSPAWLKSTISKSEFLA